MPSESERERGGGECVSERERKKERLKDREKERKIERKRKNIIFCIVLAYNLCVKDKCFNLIIMHEI